MACCCDIPPLTIFLKLRICQQLIESSATFAELPDPCDLQKLTATSLFKDTYISGNIFVEIQSVLDEVANRKIDSRRAKRISTAEITILSLKFNSKVQLKMELNLPAPKIRIE